VRWLREGRQGINRKLSIIGVLLFEIVFGLYFWITVFEDLDQAGNNLLYFALGELGANPDDEAGYSRHGLASIERGLNRIQPTSVGETSPILKEKRLCGNDGIVESMEKSFDALSSMQEPTRLFHTSHNALEKPTAQKSLRLSHIPTKSAVTFLGRF
jgi:hypothetical protein